MVKAAASVSPASKGEDGISVAPEHVGIAEGDAVVDNTKVERSSLATGEPKGAEPGLNDQNSNGPADPAKGVDARSVDARSPDSPGAGMRTSQKTGTIDMHSIANIKVKVEAILGGIQMPISQLADIKQGEIISLDSNIGEAIDIVANGQLIARGEIVVIEDGMPRFGITLTEII